MKVRSDWLVKLRISFAIHLRATREFRASGNTVIVAEMNELKTFFVVYYLTVLVYTKQLFTLVSVASGGYLTRRFAARRISTTSPLHFGE